MKKEAFVVCKARVKNYSRKQKKITPNSKALEITGFIKQ